MISSLRSLSFLALMLALAVTHLGCARFYRLPPPPSEELRAQLGTIAVVSGRFVPVADFRRPATGEGALRNAGRWAGLWAGGVAEGMLVGGGSGALVGAVLLVAGTPFAASAGAIAGAVNAPSRTEVDQFETALKAALAEFRAQELIRENLREAVRQTRDRVVVLAERGPSRPQDEDVDYRALASERIDTVLEVSISSLDMVGETAYDPPALAIRVQTRLVRVADGTTLYTHRLWYRGPPRAMADWIVDGARPFRDEVASGCRVLAATIADEVFLRVMVK